MDRVQNFTSNIDSNGNSSSLPCSGVNKVWFNGHNIMFAKSNPTFPTRCNLLGQTPAEPGVSTRPRLTLTRHPALCLGGPKMWLLGPDFHISGLGSTALSVHMKLSLASPQLAQNALISFRSCNTDHTLISAICHL